MDIPSFVLITGASSGIGRALAHEYAALGSTLYLVSRTEEPLDKVVQECRMLGANAYARPADVSDAPTMAGIIAEIERRVPIDLVIANAGGGDTQPKGAPLAPFSNRIFGTNIDGTMATIHPVIEAMRTRGQGQVVIMSSLAGYLPLKASPAYSAAKAALKTYGAALRSYLKPDGINVTVITPGFVNTPATRDAPHPLPFLVGAESAARKIRIGVQRNKATIAFPWQLVWLTRLAQFLPNALVNFIAR